MLFQHTNPSEKRTRFREALRSGKILCFPGAWSPLVAMQIEQAGFDGIYVSGSVLSNDLGYPDIGLTTLTEVSQRGRQISRVTQLPTIIDADTGFGVPMNVARSVAELVEMGLAGCHLEDQENPKRCGHLDGKSLISVNDMTMKIRAAVEGKKMDPQFLLIVRTDARSSEGLEGAIRRAKAYVDAGAEMIFPEALEDLKEFEAFRKAVSVPLLVNMTEFGKSQLFTAKELEGVGFNLVIYPVTTLRLAMKAVADGLQRMKLEGTQDGLVPQMQTRQELYNLTHYQDYNQFDQNIFNFE